MQGRVTFEYIKRQLMYYSRRVYMCIYKQCLIICVAASVKKNKKILINKQESLC